MLPFQGPRINNASKKGLKRTERAAYRYGPTYFSTPIVYSTPEYRFDLDDGTTVYATSVLFAPGIGAIPRPRPVGEYLLSVTTEEPHPGRRRMPLPQHGRARTSELSAVRARRHRPHGSNATPQAPRWKVESPAGLNRLHVGSRSPRRRESRSAYSLFVDFPASAAGLSAAGFAAGTVDLFGRIFKIPLTHLPILSDSSEGPSRRLTFLA